MLGLIVLSRILDKPFAPGATSVARLRRSQQCSATVGLIGTPQARKCRWASARGFPLSLRKQVWNRMSLRGRQLVGAVSTSVRHRSVDRAFGLYALCASFTLAWRMSETMALAVSELMHAFRILFVGVMPSGPNGLSGRDCRRVAVISFFDTEYSVLVRLWQELVQNRGISARPWIYISDGLSASEVEWRSEGRCEHQRGGMTFRSIDIRRWNWKEKETEMRAI